MEQQAVYADVLLVINYVINTLLVACTAKLSGARPKRRRIVAAALVGAASSLTIFLPFFGFWLSLLFKLAVSAAMVLAAFGAGGARVFFRRWFLFFAVSFSFAGVMLGVWMLFAPAGMTYYNGVVYFDISPLVLIAAAAAAYAVLALGGRIMRGAGVSSKIVHVHIALGSRSVVLNGLLDTGNGLREPFSGDPAAVCGEKDLSPLLPPRFLADIAAGAPPEGFSIRMIPFSSVGGGGVLPAFRPDLMRIWTPRQSCVAENAWIAVSAEPVGDGRYSCLINPEMLANPEKMQMVVPPDEILRR